MAGGGGGLDYRTEPLTPWAGKLGTFQAMPLPRRVRSTRQGYGALGDAMDGQRVESRQGSILHNVRYRGLDPEARRDYNAHYEK